MSTEPDPEWGLSTLGIRAAELRSEEREHSPAIHATSSFIFSSAAEAAACFAGEKSANIYSRFTNPTVRAFEQRLAAMEGAQTCLATASGMAAVMATCMGLLQSGDHIVASDALFGSTTNFFANQLPRFGIRTTFVPPDDAAAWENAITADTRLLFVETPSNPLARISDIAAIAGVAHAHDCLLVVDNCFCTPALQRPLTLGADIVTHSATKYLDGQGRCVGGAVAGSEKLVRERIFPFLRNAGPCMSPFNAWVFLKGLETLTLRMRAHSDNALALARWLERQPQVARVHYAGLESHPQHALAARQQSAFGGVVAFEMKGGRDAAWRVIDGTRMISITGNLGDTRTTITHPATTTHGRVERERREAAGITEGLLRVAVGLEDIEDIQADLSRGMGA